tara:strand:- start:15003 stop:15803 length:801 start_codon:yes stop_codon:yes gene_type:complete
MKYDAYIFDVDGVLIDHSNSFIPSIVLAVRTILNDDNFNQEHVFEIKSFKNFNNDWDTAIAGYCWRKFHSSKKLFDYLKIINECGSGINGVRKTSNKLTFQVEKNIIRLVKESYGGTTACKKLYGFDPVTILNKGFWNNEISMVSYEKIKPFLDKTAIFTGRNKEEMELGFEILKWRIDDKMLAVSDLPELNKPNPKKLIPLVEKLSCKNPLYIGDSEDDSQLVLNYKKNTGKPLDFCLIQSSLNVQNYNFSCSSTLELINKIGIL